MKTQSPGEYLKPSGRLIFNLVTLKRRLRDRSAMLRGNITYIYSSSMQFGGKGMAGTSLDLTLMPRRWPL